MSSVTNNFWRKIEHPIAVLAPMAGYTDSAFRLMCKKFGADVVVTELISADAIAHNKFEIQVSKSETNYKSKISNKKQNRTIVEGRTNNSTAELLSFYEAERPIVVQLFGKNPENFGKAAKWITENLKPDGIDINMGCPARKVVGSDHGAALLKNPELAVKIVKAVKENSNLPVSVKTRLGWEDDGEILEFAPLLANAGIDAIIIHGRTYKDGFSGFARWENIYKVKKMFGDKLVVIGNGDIGSRYKTQDTITRQISNNKFQITNKNLNDQISKNISGSKSPTANRQLDGFAIGRASFGKPWVFAESKKQLSVIGHQLSELKEIILTHAKLAYETKGAKGIIEFRKHLLSYLKGFSNAKKLRIEAVKIENIDEVESILSKVEL